MKKLIISLLLVLLFVSCEERSDWELESAANDFIVVDGIITNEMKYHTVTLLKPVSRLNEKPQPVSGATLLVSSELQVYSFHEDPARAGTYISDTLFSGIRNRTYSLLVNLGNAVYSAKALLEPPVLLTEFVPIGYEKNTTDNLYHLTNIPANYNPASYAMYEIVLDWSAVPGFDTTDPGSCRAQLYYYTLPTIDVGEVFAPEVETVNFPAGTTFIQRRYSLTREHAGFIRSLLLESTWTGGYFNTAPANIPTNLSEGATGYFGACGVMEKVDVVE
jgi:hypothetical protein